MSAKNFRKLRKELGVTRENLRTPDYVEKNLIEKVVYFTDRSGDLVAKNATRSQVINRNKYFYRLEKKKRKGNNNG